MGHYRSEMGYPDNDPLDGYPVFMCSNHAAHRKHLHYEWLNKPYVCVGIKNQEYND
jgi:hypothetical protein